VGVHLSDVLSKANILEALYLDAPVIKMYVDLILQGKPAPYTLLMRSDEVIQNEEIIERVRDMLKYYDNYSTKSKTAAIGGVTDFIRECLDEAMILEDEKYIVQMLKAGVVIGSSKQIVYGNRIEDLKEYAKIKGYEISIKKVES